MKKMHYFNITYQCDSDCLFCAANIGMIDHNGYTMDPESFERQLLREGVQEGDIVLISGGEPTLSPYFWDIMDICKQNGVYVELTTNGHLFSNIEYARKLYEYIFVNVQLAFFGMKMQHEYLTGHKDSFEKKIIALDNFTSLNRTPHFTVSVKFLLCKATVEGNQEVFDYLFKRYGAKINYSLNAFLISEKAKKNSVELLETYSETLLKLGDFVENENIMIDTIPLCLLSDNKRNAFLERKHLDLKRVYADAKVTIGNIDNYIGGKCKQCRLEEHCDKFLPSYIRYFGDDEISPI